MLTYVTPSLSALGVEPKLPVEIIRNYPITRIDDRNRALIDTNAARLSRCVQCGKGRKGTDVIASVEDRTRRCIVRDISAISLPVHVSIAIPQTRAQCRTMKCTEMEHSAREATEAERVRLDFSRIQSQASIAYFVLMQCTRAYVFATHANAATTH